MAESWKTYAVVLDDFNSDGRFNVLARFSSLENALAFLDKLRAQIRVFEQSQLPDDPA